MTPTVNRIARLISLAVTVDRSRFGATTHSSSAIAGASGGSARSAVNTQISLARVHGGTGVGMLRQPKLHRNMPEPGGELLDPLACG